MSKPIKSIFIDGAIDPDKIARSIAAHQSKVAIGAHQIFLGQVRADQVDGDQVAAIEYTAQVDLANKIAHEIKERLFEKYELSCMHIYHSLGRVGVGEVCFFVFVSAPHRKAVFQALPELVDALKAELPVFGKECFERGTHQWKVNN